MIGGSCSATRVAVYLHLGTLLGKQKKTIHGVYGHRQNKRTSIRIYLKFCIADRVFESWYTSVLPFGM